MRLSTHRETVRREDSSRRYMWIRKYLDSHSNKMECALQNGLRQRVRERERDVDWMTHLSDTKHIRIDSPVNTLPIILAVSLNLNISPRERCTTTRRKPVTGYGTEKYSLKNFFNI